MGLPTGDIRAHPEQEPEVVVEDIDPWAMAAAVLQAIEISDHYIDNDWTEDLISRRALLAGRIRSVPHESLELEEPDLLSDASDVVSGL